MNNLKTIRKGTLLTKVLFVDGQPGCGKTMFTPIISSFNRLEIFNYSSEIENICALNFLKKINYDAALSMIKIQLDLFLYETMMSRRANFRPTDVSSVFKNPNCMKYLDRLMSKGDELVPEKIKKEKPILHFASHNLLAFSNPIFDSSKNKVFFIEIVRHPLYQLIQQTINYKKSSTISGSSRYFAIRIKYKNHQIPYQLVGNEKEYVNCNAVEKAILDMNLVQKLTDNNKKNISRKNKNKIMTIPFELFALNPYPYIKKIESFLNTTASKNTKNSLIEQNVPRKKISDGIPLNIYKRCGWKPPNKKFTERDELNLRRSFAFKSRARKKYIDILDKMSNHYEKKYLGSIL